MRIKKKSHTHTHTHTQNNLRIKTDHLEWDFADRAAHGDGAVSQRFLQASNVHSQQRGDSGKMGIHKIKKK